MKRYFSLYFSLLKLSGSIFFSNRAYLASGIFTNTSWTFLVVIVTFAITSRSSMVLGWKRDELLLLSTVYNVFLGIYYFLFNTNFRKLAHIISFGELDMFLLKPIDSQFLLSFQEASYTDLIRTLLAIGLSTYFLIKMHIAVSALSLLEACLLLICGLAILYTLWFTIITITIWFPQLSNLRDMLFHVNGITRYPPQMFQHASNILFFVLFPLTLIIVVPVKVLLQKAFFGDIVWLVFFSFFLLFLSRKFWKFALQFYTSAGG